MKLANKETGLTLIDCGSVKQQTKGLFIGFFRENALPPFDLSFVYNP